ncbi:MotA/TolQ/ExbB proton channel family protein [Amantichitinum ursilacus]|uniref:Biopolymer transport protein ExbB n=1 Tax=Amantichitinum ursilacus TaxID=857265 RepID=A0A0N0XHC7_9NEIS|nr:MotA/TolQ/ExbB proton channel family protein [Amantichitinum ursilacus]KPC49390.1 Biopolymer transport protein ExbB [Amantichitinum ursilacus]
MQPQQFSLSHLWAQGDFITHTIAAILLIMSVASWYVIVTHTLRVIANRRRAAAAHGFWHAHRFDEGLALLTGKAEDNPFRLLALESQAAVSHHKENQADLHGQLALSDWLISCLNGAIEEGTERMQRGLSILASVGSTAPFVGLFGTVWGIYHALIGISAAGAASIDKIAGPVGESLVMTAFGLAVAIPAVLAYNALVRGNRAVVGKLNRFAQDLHAYFVTGAPVAREQQGGRPQLAVVNGQTKRAE